MPLASAEAQGAAVPVEAWRDYDAAARVLPGMRLDLPEPGGATAREDAERLHAAGARCVRLPEPVEVCAGAGPRSARALALVRELTGRAVAVEWTARCGDGCAASGKLGHLYPPEEVERAAAGAARAWREAYFPGKCVFRRGPGFVEVRDRRFGALELFTIDEPPFLAAIGVLRDGAAAGAVPEGVLAELEGARLVSWSGGRAWWLPLAVHRWPFGSFAM
ncbi:DUF5825 family protein [Streptomyces toxytricini]|uniref:DUF5825 family protein n=1 Tax=Streptomyces toxytricini TaxID=67369 RepID=UPI00341FAA15